MPENVDTLIRAGRLADAARALEEQGQHLRAVELYEQLWDHAAAAHAARTAGDLPRSMNNMLQVRDADALETLLLEVERANPSVTRECAVVSEERGAWSPAARLFLASGDRASAARCLEQVGELAEAARLREELGELKPAMELYRQHLTELEETNTEAAIVAEPAHQLGRILLRFGRADEALPLLQQAWRTSSRPETTLAAGRAVVAALARLGYGAGAHFAAAQLSDQSGTEVEVRECTEDPELTPVRAGEEKVLAGRYLLGNLLGSGGMGRVYIAEDRLNERKVAVKVFTAPGGARGRDAFRRFVKEARTTGQLKHPHIVSLLDFHEEMGFMVLEFMEGGTLAERLRPRLDLPTCRTVALQVIAGLAAAHQRGIVHRDIKPTNVFFTTAGAAKLGDFGVAHLQDAGQTQTGAFIGTLAFMSPEQIKGEPVTFATDIYALGVSLFQMLTGQLPFTHPDLVTKHLTAAPPAPSSLIAGLPSICDDVVLRCLEKDPPARFGSLESLRRAVEQFPTREESGLAAEPERPAARPARPRRAGDRRYTMESIVVDEGPLQIQEVQDTHLGRPALLVRVAPGDTRAPLFQLLSVAASSGTRSLQRVLLLDRDKGQALLEAPAGETPSLPPDGDEISLWMAESAGQALAPLHREGLVHGGLAPDQITHVENERGVTVSLIGALRARACGSASLPDATTEVSGLVRLLGLSPGGRPIPDGAALARWAHESWEQMHEKSRNERREALLERLMRSAPEKVRGTR